MRRRIVVMSEYSPPTPTDSVRPKPPPARKIARHCNVPGCDISVPPTLLMCRKHWGMVPIEIRRDVWRYFDFSQREVVDRRPTEAWVRAERAASESVLDVLVNRLVKSVASPKPVLVLEDDPPAGMTTHTFRVVLRRAIATNKLRFDSQNRVAPF